MVEDGVFAGMQHGLVTAFAVIGLAISSQAVAQNVAPGTFSSTATTARSSSSDTSGLAFDVVSIHKNDGDDSPSGLVEDGYKSIGRPLWRTIAYAYFPAQMRDPKWIKGAPSWVFDENFDIVAKMSPENLAAWRKVIEQPSFEENPELQSMFVKLLEDRCHIKTHRVASEVDGYALESGQKPRISIGQPDNIPHPAAIMRDGQGSITYFEKEDSHGWIFQNCSMKLLLSFLSLFSGAQIRDKTNLSERYNFTLEVSDQERATSESQSQSTSNDFAFIQIALRDAGFRLTRSSVPLNLVVVDHIERPTAN